jgi:hypothetical protein
MQLKSLTHACMAPLGYSIALCSAALGCASAPKTAGIPPAPIVFRWPDPAFLPERQCHGAYSVAELEQFRLRAQRALQLPGTRTVAVDAERRCLTVIVEGIEAGRLAELALRGVAVPRAAVLLQLAEPERHG